MSGRHRWLRISAISLGILWIFWLPVEDDSLLAVYLFAIVSSTLSVFRVERSHLLKSWKPGFRMVSLGCLAGTLVTPVALLLMAFKSGLHGHNTSDYAPNQILAVIRSFPIWFAGGGILGLGWHMLTSEL